ncbi:MAG: SRPBCC domain-containing protein [Burkholderiales bacterium]|nr:SRPBCC domain-containing protein [Burkholderiales bacterium]
MALRQGIVLCGLLGLPALPALAAERSLDKEVLVPAPVAAVWASWTTREGIRGFFAPDAEIDARVGGAFHIHIDPLAAPGRKGADDMRFMALQPMKMLSFDWNAPPSLPEARAQRTFVVVRLEAVDDKTTRVRLHHTGWGDGGEWDKAYAYFDRAWGNVLANLKQRHESGPKDWTEWLDQLRKMHAAADKAWKP